MPAATFRQWLVNQPEALRTIKLVKGSRKVHADARGETCLVMNEEQFAGSRPELWSLSEGRLLETLDIRQGSFMNRIEWDEVILAPQGLGDQPHRLSSKCAAANYVWDGLAGQTVRRMNVERATFTPHGDYVVGWSRDGTIAVMPAPQPTWPAADLLVELEVRSGTMLTPEGTLQELRVDEWEARRQTLRAIVAQRGFATAATVGSLEFMLAGANIMSSRYVVGIGVLVLLSGAQGLSQDTKPRPKV